MHQVDYFCLCNLTSSCILTLHLRCIFPLTCYSGNRKEYSDEEWLRLMKEWFKQNPGSNSVPATVRIINGPNIGNKYRKVITAYNTGLVGDIFRTAIEDGSLPMGRTKTENVHHVQLKIFYELLEKYNVQHWMDIPAEIRHVSTNKRSREIVAKNFNEYDEEDREKLSKMLESRLNTRSSNAVSDAVNLWSEYFNISNLRNSATLDDDSMSEGDLSHAATMYFNPGEYPVAGWANHIRPSQELNKKIEHILQDALDPERRSKISSEELASMDNISPLWRMSFKKVHKAIPGINYVLHAYKNNLPRESIEEKYLVQLGNYWTELNNDSGSKLTHNKSANREKEYLGPIMSKYYVLK